MAPLVRKHEKSTKKSPVRNGRTDKFTKNEELNLWLNKNSMRQYISPIEIVGYVFESIVLCNSNRLSVQNILGAKTKVLDIVKACQEIIGAGKYNFITEKDVHLYSANIAPAKKFILKNLNAVGKKRLINDNLIMQIEIQVEKNRASEYEFN